MLRLLCRLALLALLIVVILLLAIRWSAVRRESLPAEGLMPDTGGFVTAAGERFYILSAGPEDGQPVLLAHGTAAWSGFWQNELELLGQKGYRAIAFDMPPFGFSDRAADGDYSRPRQAQRIIALAGTLERAPILVAHSFGAAAGTEAVLRDPGAFAGLVIVDGAIGMADTPTAARLPLPLRPMPLREVAVAATATNPRMTGRLLAQMLHRKEAATERNIRILQLPLRREGTTRAYAEWLPALLAPTPEALSRRAANYRDLSLPVRIIWGDKDTVTPPVQAEALAAAIGQAPVRYLKDVGHVPHIEAPRAFSAALVSVLGEMTE